MTTYLIHESNLERLEKKINTIKNKCTRNNVEFTYNVVGEQFLECQDKEGNKYTARYVEVEVEGFLKHEGWRFAAVLEHHGEDGNIVRAMDSELEIPARFRTCGPTCEHCNRIRDRKDTYVVYNEATGEFKQVGKQCMQEYTNGLDAEEVASYISLFSEMMRGEYFGGSSHKSYLEINEIIRYAFECVKHFGYEKSSEYAMTTTRGRVCDYIRHDRGWRVRDAIKEEMEKVGFDADSEYAVETTKKALEWIRNEEADNDYIHNLKVACASDYAEQRDLGLLVSLPVAYNRHVEDEQKKAELAEKKAAQMDAEGTSEYQGNIKDKLTVTVKNFQCVTSFYNQFGTTFLYKWLDNNNNVYIWYASNPVNNSEIVIEITGTVKDHSEFNGVKQTVLTRCKVTKSEEKKEEENHEIGQFDLDSIMYPWEEA